MRGDSTRYHLQQPYASTQLLSQHEYSSTRMHYALVYPKHGRARVGARADGAHGVPEGDVGRHVALEGRFLDVGRVRSGELLHDGLYVFDGVLHRAEIGWWWGREMGDGSRRVERMAECCTRVQAGDGRTWPLPNSHA